MSFWNRLFGDTITPPPGRMEQIYSFSVGDTVWYMRDNMVYSSKVIGRSSCEGVLPNWWEDHGETYFTQDHPEGIQAEEVYATREDLVNSL